MVVGCRTPKRFPEDATGGGRSGVSDDILSPMSPENPNHRPSELLPLLYDELWVMAESHLRREHRRHTLRPTELLHEAYLKLKQDPRLTFTGRVHFLGFATRAMRQILVDYARKRASPKHGGNLQRVTLDEALDVSATGDVDLIELTEALDRLAELDPDSAQVVELRFLSGLTEVEVAEYLSRSERWVRDQWKFGRAWLRSEMA